MPELQLQIAEFAREHGRVTIGEAIKRTGEPLTLIEAKDGTHRVGDGMQQGLEYAETLDIPFVFSSNGKGCLFHDRTGNAATTETALSLADRNILVDQTRTNDFKPFGQAMTKIEKRQADRDGKAI